MYNDAVNRIYLPKGYMKMATAKKKAAKTVVVSESKEEKLKALSDAYWSAANSGYCDSMANRLMAGQRDSMTDWWEKNCSNQAVIDRYFNWLKEQDG